MKTRKEKQTENETKEKELNNLEKVIQQGCQGNDTAIDKANCDINDSNKCLNDCYENGGSYKHLTGQDLDAADDKTDDENNLKHTCIKSAELTNS